MFDKLLRQVGYQPIEEIQSLWSGYGQVVRCFSQQLNRPVVIKVVAPEGKTKHPRGWNTDIGHQRKLRSYQVESNFYQHFSHQTNDGCKVPVLFKVEPFDKGLLLVMEDLHNSGFSIEHKNGNQDSLAIAIKWLANFHATFMNVNTDNLWSTGGYWHLTTRQDEWQNMPAGALKENATVIDSTLNNARYETLIHGDAKFANLCFHDAKDEVAAVDFQYVGRGVGVKDLAYLVGSCLDNEQLFSLESYVLETYFEQLKVALLSKGWQGDWSELEAEYTYLYPFAWADFHRFLLGWNPDSWKICLYMREKTETVLSKLTC
jgi:hypothetical protein